MAIGATATITYSVTTVFPATGDHSLLNTALSTSPGNNCLAGTDPRCSTSVAVQVPALTITKAADTSEIVAGGTIHYSVSATNTGEADYPPRPCRISSAAFSITVSTSTTRSPRLVCSGTRLACSAGQEPCPSEAPSSSATPSLSPLADTGNRVASNSVESTSVGSTCPAGGDDPGCATSTTIFAQTVSLTGLSPDFTLAGLPDSTASKDGATTMTVTTNSAGGYVVTVQAETDALTGAAPNTDTIPVSRLGVRESGTTLFQTLSRNIARVVHRQESPSAPAGDAVSNDYQIQIPFVAADSYSTTLDYIVRTQ